jgi:hypothetical protein
LGSKGKNRRCLPPATSLQPFLFNIPFISQARHPFTIDDASEVLMMNTVNMSLSIDETLQFCKNKLCASNYPVLQVGYYKLLAYVPGTALAFIEVTMDVLSSHTTEITVTFHETAYS